MVGSPEVLVGGGQRGAGRDCDCDRGESCRTDVGFAAILPGGGWGCESVFDDGGGGGAVGDTDSEIADGSERAGGRRGSAWGR